mmetsp:Transcript_134670/g.430153  ORF Transcript_134670/g.430153 Transcript_134670/m.430153 type:complete len:213 (+) Transcript_134670:1778-2416(+)
MGGGGAADNAEADVEEAAAQCCPEELRTDHDAARGRGSDVARRHAQAQSCEGAEELPDLHGRALGAVGARDGDLAGQQEEAGAHAGLPGGALGQDDVPGCVDRLGHVLADEVHEAGGATAEGRAPLHAREQVFAGPDAAHRRQAREQFLLAGGVRLQCRLQREARQRLDQRHLLSAHRQGLGLRDAKQIRLTEGIARQECRKGLGRLARILP